jgi:mannosyltransferase
LRETELLRTPVKPRSGVGIDSKRVWGRVCLLLGIVLFGLALRVHDLEKESLWRDEVYSVNMALEKFSEIIKTKDTNPPLYYLVLTRWMKVFGHSEGAVRFPSVIFGVVSIVLIYRHGKELFSESAGIVSAAILSVSTFHIYYSQEARAYSLMVCLALLSNLFYWRFGTRKKAAGVAGYIICSVLLIYTHVYGLFVILSQNAHFAVFRWRKSNKEEVQGKEWLLIQGIIWLCFLPWVGILISQSIGVAKTDFWIQEPQIRDLYKTIVAFIGHDKLVWLYLLLLFFTFVMASFQRKREKGGVEESRSVAGDHEIAKGLETSKLMFLLMLFFCSVVLPFFISKTLAPIFVARYTIVGAVALYLGIGFTIAKVPWRLLRHGLLFVIILLSVMNTWQRYYKPITREQWRDSAAYMDRNSMDGDLILFNTSGSVAAFKYYSDKETVKTIPLTYSDSIRSRSNTEYVYAVLGEHERVWTVLNNFRNEENEALKEMLTEEYELEVEKKFRGIVIWGFEKRHAEKGW